MSTEMSPAQDEGAFAEIHETLQRMRRSSRASVPMVILGLLLTLAAAGVAIYYIITLSSSNAELQASLGESRAALLQSREAQVKAIPLLEGARGASTADTNRIRQAVQELRRGVETLESAQRGLATASASLSTAGVSSTPDPTETGVETGSPQTNAPDGTPAPAPERVLPPVIPGRAFAVLGSFEPDEPGRANAFGLASTLGRRGLCVEIWQANTSRHLAVVLGGVASEDEARERAQQARAEGIAPDAYAQFDRGWARVEGSPQCGAAAPS